MRNFVNFVKNRYLEVGFISWNAPVFTGGDTWQSPSPRPLRLCHYAKFKYLEIRVCIITMCNLFPFLVITLVKLYYFAIKEIIKYS